MMKAILKMMGRKNEEDSGGPDQELFTLRHKLQVEAVGLRRVSKVALRNALITEMTKREQNDPH